MASSLRSARAFFRENAASATFSPPTETENPPSTRSVTPAPKPGAGAPSRDPPLLKRLSFWGTLAPHVWSLDNLLRRPLVFQRLLEQVVEEDPSHGHRSCNLG